jgi:hypothetical protein
MKRTLSGVKEEEKLLQCEIGPFLREGTTPSGINRPSVSPIKTY